MKTKKIIRITFITAFVLLIAVALVSLIWGIVTGGADTDLLSWTIKS